MSSPFSVDKFLADIDTRFNLDDDQIQDQDQAAANENNSAQLADVANTQLGALDQALDTETNTVAGAGGAGGVAVGGSGGSADGSAASVATTRQHLARRQPERQLR